MYMKFFNYTQTNENLGVKGVKKLKELNFQRKDTFFLARR